MQHHFKAYFMVGKQKFCLRDICTIFWGEYNKMSQDSFWCMVLQKIETDFSMACLQGNSVSVPVLIQPARKP